MSDVTNRPFPDRPWANDPKEYRPFGRPGMPSERLANSLFYSVNDLGVTAKPLVMVGPSREAISFHNPGVNTCVVAPLRVLVDGRNHELKLTAARLGGGFVLHPGQFLYFSGNAAQQAWQGLALAGTDNPLTIQEQSGAPV